MIANGIKDSNLIDPDTGLPIIGTPSNDTGNILIHQPSPQAAFSQENVTVINGDGAIISGGGKNIVMSGNVRATATPSVGSGKKYMEFIVENFDGSTAMSVGLVSGVDTNTNAQLAFPYGVDYVCMWEAGYIFKTGGGTVLEAASWDISPVVVGFAVDFDLDEIGVYQDGTLLTTVTDYTSSGTGPLYPWASCPGYLEKEYTMVTTEDELTYLPSGYSGWDGASVELVDRLKFKSGHYIKYVDPT